MVPIISPRDNNVIKNITFGWMMLCYIDYIYKVVMLYDPYIHNTLSSVIVFNPHIIYTTNIMTAFTIIYETMFHEADFVRIIGICDVLVGLNGVLRTAENTISHDLFAVTTFSGIMIFMEHTKGRSHIKKLALYINIALTIKIILKKLIGIPNIFYDECLFVLLFGMHYLLRD